MVVDGFLRVLLINDLYDFNDGISKLLEKEYRVKTISTEVNYLIIIDKFQPDVILVSSFQEGAYIKICESIKSYINTCQIPIILGSDKIGTEHLTDAYNSGVNIVCNAPEQEGLLSAIIKSTVKNQQVSKYGYAAIKPGGEDTFKVFFRNQVEKIVKDNYKKSSFGVTDISDKMNRSRTTIFTWFKICFGKSASNFIKDYRLNQSFQILKNEVGLNIAEVAYKVGFHDPKYFSKQFKNKFGINPSEFQKTKLQSL
ncbi:helix-turn-helix domain-containing protein [Flavobacteriaceae bacterium]|nr:helix-turn-helix domain-containing protein [Flavobacteriaceae bacterium]